MSQIVVDESEREKDDEEVKAGRRATLSEEERGGRLKNRNDDGDVDDEPQDLAGERGEHGKRKECERHDRRVEVTVTILEPVYCLAGHGPLRGPMIDLEIAHAAR